MINSRYTIIKYVLTAAIAVFVIIMAVSGSAGNADFADVRASVESVLDQDALMESGSSGLKRYYSLNAADYDGVMLYQATTGISAEEVLLIKVKDTDDIAAIKSAIEKRQESRLTDFEGYAPKEEALIKDAKIIVKGKFIFYTASSDADKYTEAFLKAV